MKPLLRFLKRLTVSPVILVLVLLSVLYEFTSWIFTGEFERPTLLNFIGDFCVDWADR